MEAALETIRQKTLVGNRLAAYFLITVGFVFGGLGIYEIIKAISTGHWWQMTFFSPAIAIISFVLGILYLRMLKKKT